MMQFWSASPFGVAICLAGWLWLVFVAFVAFAAALRATVTRKPLPILLSFTAACYLICVAVGIAKL